MGKQSQAKSSKGAVKVDQAKTAQASPTKTGKASRHQDRRNAEESALRALSNKFPTMKISQFEKKGPGGKSWMEVVTAECGRPEKKDTRMRDCFWKRARLEVEGDSPTKGNKATKTLKESKAQVNEKLWSALRKARTINCTSKSRTDLIQYLASVREMTTVEFSGLTAHFMEREHPGASKVSLRLCCALMRAVKRLKLDQKEIQACHKLSDLFEATCLASWSSMKRDLVDWKEWWMVMSVPGSLVLPEATVNKIRDASEIEAVMPDIRTLVSSSILGKRLFGCYLNNSDSAAITKIIEQELEAWMVGCVGLAEVNGFKDKVNQRVGEAALATSGKREVKFTFQGVQMQMEVGSVGEESHCRVMAFVKEHVAESQLAANVWEAGVLSRKPIFAGLSFNDELLGPAVAGRRLCRLASKGVQLQAIAGYLESEHDNFLALDETWFLDQLQLESLSKEGGQSLVDAELLACLPAVAGPLRTLPQAIEQVETVSNSNLVRVAGAMGARRVQVLQEVLLGMQKGADLDASDFADSDLLTRAKNQLSLLCQYRSKDSASSNETVKTGLEAAQLYFGDLQKSEGPNSFEDLREVMAFSFLLSADDKKTIHEWNQKLLSKSSAGAKKRAVAKATASKKSKMKEVAEQDAEHDLAELFG